MTDMRTETGESLVFASCYLAVFVRTIVSSNLKGDWDPTLPFYRRIKERKTKARVQREVRVPCIHSLVN